MIRIARSVVVMASIAACALGGSDDAPLRRADGSPLSSSGGEVSLSDGSHLQFVITSERYKQWENARAALRKNVITRFGQILQPKSPSQKTVDRAVAFLEADVTSREAIERTGMSVRDFVLMTVALEQEMRLASQRGTTRGSTALPEPTFDSMGATSGAASDAYVPMPMPAPMPRHDSVAPIDRAAPRSSDVGRTPVRDTTVKRDTILPPAPRDTLPKSDTLRKQPRDSVRDTAAVRSRAVER